MVHPLAGIKAKIERADAHLKALEEQARGFLDGKPYALTLERDAHLRYNLRAQVSRQPSEDFGAILGDAIHNLRSALDHLIWQIVAALGNEAGKWNCFPIYDLSKDFDRDVTTPRARGRKSPLLGVDDATFAAIRSLQPFSGPQDQVNGLGIIRDLSNVDKHQSIHTSMFAMVDAAPSIDGDGFVFAQVEWGPVTVQDGAILARITFFPDESERDLDVRATFPVEVRFGEIGIPLSKLYEVRNAVVYCLNVFGQGFGSIEEADSPPLDDAAGTQPPSG